MRNVRIHFALLVGATFLAFSTPHAGAQTVNACQSKKKLCVAKKEAALLKCHAKAEKTGAPVDTSCLQKAKDKFDGGADPTKGCFAKLEAKGGCLTTNDTASLENMVDTFVNSAVSQLDPGFPAPVLNACAAAKKKCVGNKAKALLKCHAKAEKTGTLDTTCVTKAQTKFADPVKGCFAKAESKGSCLTIGDTTNLENTVDTFVQSAVCALDSATPGCGGGPCPTSYAFLANGAAADLDEGWTGELHDVPATSHLGLAGSLSSCANPVTPCGQCTISGPSVSPGPGLQYRRCSGDGVGNNGSWLSCTSNVDCPGTGNACVVFLGPAQPQAIGGVSICTVLAVEGTFTGVVNVDTGDTTIPLAIRQRVYNGPLVDTPCPVCTGGTCSAGQRSGQACVVTGNSALFADDVSLDCPPLGGGLLTSTVQTLTLSTGSQALTNVATSPKCRAVGWTSNTCACDTCDNAAATPCHTDAECTTIGATKCGGKRCIGGTNSGTPCAAPSECPGGACNVPGTTAGNQCNDDVCSPNPGDTDSSNEGVCSAGPFDKFCNIQTYRACLSNSDCPASGDTCNIAGKPRECFTDNAALGGTTSVAGTASTTSPTLGGLGCAGPTTASAVNAAAGLPGIIRYTLPGTATIN
jgi:hypothetical protein